MIGVFDSGLGGLSVLAAISRALPHSDLLYLADTAHVPYGEKSDAYIRERVLCIGQHLAGQGCQQIVVACQMLPNAQDPLADVGIALLAVGNVRRVGQIEQV